MNALSFAADGQSLASGANDGGVKVWDAVTGEEWVAIRAHDPGTTVTLTFTLSNG